MPHKLKLIVISSITALATGCASIPPSPVEHDSNLSRALNIASAAGLKDLQDSEVTPDQYKHMLTNNLVLDAGWTWSNYTNPAPGVSSGVGLGLGLASLLLPRKSPAASNSLMAWLPEEEAQNADDAKQKILHETVESIKATLGRLNATYSGPFYEQSNLLGSVAAFRIEDTKLGCGSGENGSLPPCGIVLAIDYVEKAYAPASLTGSSYPAYALNSGSVSKRSILNIRSAPESKLDHLSLYVELSKDMPKWVANYIAPKKTTDSTGMENTTPMIIIGGSVEWFVIPTAK